MKKRRVIPVVAAGGLIALIASQFFSFNLGVNQSDTSVIDPDAESSEKVQPEGPTVAQSPTQSSVLSDAKLWLIDVLIDGQDYSVSRVTSDDESASTETRESLSVAEIVDQVRQAEGDASGTRVRISRTPEAVASAEKKLAQALEDAGITEDVVEMRQRLVEPSP